MKGFFLLVLGLLIVILLHNAQDLLPRTQLSDVKPDYDQVDYYLADFSLKAIAQDGRINHTLDAQYMGHWREKNTSFIVAPRIERQLPAQHSTITAEEATLEHVKQQVLFNGQVKVLSKQNSLKDSQQFTLETAFLRYGLNDSVLSTDSEVKITGPKLVLQGVGLESKLDEATLRLNKNVRSVYQAVPP